MQLQLISLAAEALGRDRIVFAQTREEDLKPGQKEGLEDALNAAQKIHDEQCNSQGGLTRDLASLEDDMARLASKTKQTVAEMQQVRRLSLLRFPSHGAHPVRQQYNLQRTKLFKGLNRHIELLAAL